MHRITYGMSIQRTLLDQQRNMYNMDNILRQMSSRKKYSRPSDSPINVSKIMRLQTELRVNKTYKDSIADAESWTSKTDDSLRNLKKIIDRMKELVTRAATGSLSTEDKQQIEAELRELKKSAITIANDDYMGKHQFSGHKTDMKFMNEDGTYNRNLNLAGLNYEEINYIIGVSQKTKVNFTGVDVFGHENYHTNTRSENYIPFDQDKPRTLLGGKMSITIQKYDKLYSNMPKEERPAEYEKDQVLEKTKGKEITFNDITYYNNYDRNDINSVVEEMNNSLMDKIRLKALEEYPGTTADDIEKRKAFETELRNAVQFVNDNGKIALVTDNDYGLEKITSGNIEFNKIEKNAEVSGTPLKNKKIKLENLDNNEYDNARKNGGVLPVATSFDITFKTYKKDENGDLINPVKENSSLEIKDIVFARTYNVDENITNEQMAHKIAQDLRTEIDKKIREFNSTSPQKIDPNEIKVVVDKDNNIHVVTDKYNDIKIENKPNSGDNFIEEKVDITQNTNKSPYEPDKDKGTNTTTIIDLKLKPSITKNNEDYISNINFDLNLKAYPDINGETGDLLYVGHKRDLESLKKEIDEKKDYLGKIPGKKDEKEKLLKDLDPKIKAKNTELQTKKDELKTALKDYNDKKKDFDEKYPLLIAGKHKDDQLDPLREKLNDPKTKPEDKPAIQKQIDEIIKKRQEEKAKAEKELSEANKKVLDTQNEVNKLSSEISALNNQKLRLPSEIKKLENDKSTLEKEIPELEKEKKRLEDLLKAAGVNPYGELDLASGMKGNFKINLVNKYNGSEDQVKLKIKEDIETQIRNQMPRVNKEMRKALEDKKEEIKNELNKSGITKEDKEKFEAQLSRINTKLSSNKDIITANDIDVTFNNGDVSIKINGNIGYELKDNVKNNLSIKSFGTTDPAGIPTPETKKDIDIDIKVANDGDTHVYMDLNLDITEYQKDEFGDEQTDKEKQPIKIDEITLNKKYPRVKPGSDPLEKYTDKEIQNMIAEDIKKTIEDKINSLNPPIQKNGIKVEFDKNNPTKVTLKVSPDLKVKLSHDDMNDAISGNPQLSSKPKYVPTHNEDGKAGSKKPEREMMPFFEMIDRIMHMCHVGDSEGLSRMQDVIKWHAENNLRVQGEGGGRSNLYKIMTERTEDLEENYKDLLSDTQNTDYAEASANLSLLSYLYRASLAVTAKIIQPSLVDFLR